MKKSGLKKQVLLSPQNFDHTFTDETKMCSFPISCHHFTKSVLPTRSFHYFFSTHFIADPLENSLNPGLNIQMMTWQHLDSPQRSTYQIREITYEEPQVSTKSCTVMGSNISFLSTFDRKPLLLRFGAFSLKNVSIRTGCSAYSTLSRLSNRSHCAWFSTILSWRPSVQSTLHN